MIEKSTLEQALDQIYPLIRKVSFELYRANKDYLVNMLAEDYSQDIYYELCNFYNNRLKKEDPEKAKRLDDVIPIFINRVGLERLHFLSSHVTSLYTEGRTRDMKWTPANSYGEDLQQIDWLSPEDRFEIEVTFSSGDLGYKDYEFPEVDFNYRLLREMKKWETTAPGVTKFVEESLNPSERTLKRFQDYKDNLKKNKRVQRKMSGGNIPPVVLLELLGDNRNRISSFKRVISFALNDLGMKKERIVSLWNLADLYFTNRAKLSPVHE